jgi:hypothetical protein
MWRILKFVNGRILTICKCEEYKQFVNVKNITIVNVKILTICKCEEY